MLQRHFGNPIAMLLILALTLASSACGPTPTSTPRPPRSAQVDGPACPDVFQETQQQQISEAAEISVGGALTLTLGATPSVPCGWHAPEIEDPAVVQQVDHQSQWPAEGATPQPGAPGTEIWSFEALNAGESTISVDCVCLTEEGSEEEVRGTFVLKVTVQDSG